MEVGTVVVGVLAIAAAGACVWLLVGRAKLLAEAAGARATAAGAEQDRDRLQAELGAAATKLEEVGAARQSLSLQVVRLQEEAQSAAEAHRAEKLRIEQVAAGHVKAAEERERTFREEVQKRDSTRDQAMREAFAALSAQTLSKTSEEFLKLAEAKLASTHKQGEAALAQKSQQFEQLIKPISETLQKTDEKLAAIDKSRAETAASLNEQLRAAADASKLLRDETGKLVRALREPHVRGRYGELQLRRVAELAGMSAYCDFSEQTSSVDSAGNALRPDMIVKLPSERVVVVDAKTNIQAYLDALQAESPEAAEGCLDRFARHVSEQATALARKKYWSQYDGSPEFVVMFIPGDQFIDAALSRQPELLETAARQGVLLAGPATLIGLLRAVAVGYREQRLADEARALRDLGIEFHQRAATAFKNIAELGAAIEKTVSKYNDFVGSYESRLEPTLKKFEDAGVKSGKELPVVVQVNTNVRAVESSLPALHPA